MVSRAHGFLGLGVAEPGGREVLEVRFSKFPGLPKALS